VLTTVVIGHFYVFIECQLTRWIIWVRSKSSWFIRIFLRM